MQCPRVRGERRGSPRGSAGRAGRRRRARGRTCGGAGGKEAPGPRTHLRWSRSCSASCWCCSTSARSRRTASWSCEFSSRRPHPSPGLCSATPAAELAGPGPPASYAEGGGERCLRGAPRRARRAGPRTRGGDDGDLRSPQPAAAAAAGSPCGFLQTPVRRISEAGRRAGGGRPGL